MSHIELAFKIGCNYYGTLKSLSVKQRQHTGIALTYGAGILPGAAAK
jgi:hypothetical protein